MKKLWAKENRGAEIGGCENSQGCEILQGYDFFFFEIFFFTTTLFLLQCSTATVLWLFVVFPKLLSYELCEISQGCEIYSGTPLLQNLSTNLQK